MIREVSDLGVLHGAVQLSESMLTVPNSPLHVHSTQLSDQHTLHWLFLDQPYGTGNSCYALI